MEEFINDEIDMILDDINSDREDEDLEPVELSSWQREQIFMKLRDSYEYIWEDMYNAISNEIENFIED